MFPTAPATASLQVTLGSEVISCTSPVTLQLFNPTGYLVLCQLEESITFADVMLCRLTVRTHRAAFRCGGRKGLTGLRQGDQCFNGGVGRILSTMENGCTSGLISLGSCLVG